MIVHDNYNKYEIYDRGPEATEPYEYNILLILL